jgi:copper transporter 1
MLWNWDSIDTCYLTSSWHITNNGMFAASCIGAAILSIMLEALRRVNRSYDAYILSQLSALNTANDYKPVTRRATALQQGVRAVLHAVLFGLAYIVMLIVMAANGYMIISIIIGAGIGKFFCDWLVLDGDGGVKRDECVTVCCN